MRALVRGCCMAAALAGLVMVGKASGQVSTVSIGAGLEAVRDWSRTNAYVDLIRQSRSFGPAATPWEGSVPLDADGWPTTDFGVIVFLEAEGLVGLGGVYPISFKASQIPTIDVGNSPATVRHLVRNAATGVVSGEVVIPEGGSHLILGFYNTGGGVRDLSIRRPGYGVSDVFTTAFLGHVARFDCLRFMDWTATNESAVVEWSHRAKPSDAQFRRAGQPWEACIDLANTVDRDLWINIPHMASDDYVRQLAALLRTRLEPGRSVYVEYGNELWNYQFDHAQWNLAQAIDDVAAGRRNLNYDGINNTGYWAWRRVAVRLKEISDLFRAEWGDSAINTRVRCVLAGQMINPSVVSNGLGAVETLFGPPSRYFYAVAGAPYFFLGGLNNDPLMTHEQVIAALTSSAAAVPATYQFERNAALAAWYGVRFLGYEGGPDTFGPNGIAAKRAAHYDPRMRTICAEFLRQWYAHGMGLFNWFVGGATDWDTEYGAWGLTEDMTNQQTPKIQAIDDVRLGAPPPITAGSPVPSSIDARRHVARETGWDSGTPYAVFSPNQARDYLVRSAASGVMLVSVRYATWHPGMSVKVAVNNGPVTTLSLPHTNGGTLFRTLPATEHPASAGLSVVRLRSAGSENFNIESITVGLKGDANRDGSVGFQDLVSVLTNWNIMIDPQGLGDANGDGTVNLADLTAALTNWGAGS